MEKPILEQYEKQIDVDDFVLTESGREEFENDEYKYHQQQDAIEECRCDFTNALDDVIERYKGTLHNLTIRDILEEVSNNTYSEL